MKKPSSLQTKHSQAFRHIAETLSSVGLISEKLKITVDNIAQAISAKQVSLIGVNMRQKKVVDFVDSGTGAKAPSKPTFEDFLKEIEEPEISGKIVIPIRFGEKILGTISAIPVNGKLFTADERSFMAAVGSQTAAVIAHNNLSLVEQNIRQQTETLREVTQIINASLDQTQVLELILDQLARVVEYDSASVMLVDNEEVSIVAYRKFRSEEQFQIPKKIKKLAHIEEVIEKRHPVIIPDTLEDPRWSKLSHSNYIRSWLGVPLAGKKKVIGLLNLDKEQPAFYNQEDAILATAFANQAAIAIDNARLYQSAREAAERRSILHNVSQQIVSASLDQEDIFTAIHNAAAQLMPAEAFVISWLNEEKQMIDAVYLIDRSGRTPVQSIHPTSGLSGRVITMGESIYIADTQDAEQLGDAVHFGDSEIVRSLLAVPMRLRGKVAGMISTQSYQPNAYSDDDRYLLEMLASYAAIAIENARLFTHIQKLAITDDLTGINNRRQLFAIGKREFQRAKRFKRDLSVVMIDIDLFKSVNDTWGHAFGDRILHKLAQFIQSHLREVDIIGRYGGEEFTLIFPETRLDEARLAAERIRDMVRNSFQEAENKKVALTISIGLATIKKGVSSFAALVEEADAALYDAKLGGRDRVETR